MTIVKGTRIKVVVEPHMAGQDTGEVVAVEERRTAYEILFDGQDESHRWYLDGEVVESTKEPSSGARVAPATAVRDGKRVRPYILSHALAIAHASEFLAIDPSAFGRAYAFPDGDDAPEPGEASEVDGGVAVVRIDGPIAQRSMAGLCGYVDGYDAIASRFAAALELPEVRAVVLAIDSPGGDVAGLFECVRRMTAARDAAGKPVLAYADETAASAAYALACVASAGIYAPTSGEIGSIGVLSIHAERSAANEKEGVTYTIARSGARKCEGNPIEPLSEAARAAMQDRVDELAGVFFAHVAAARDLDPAAVVALEGAVFGATRAVELGLATGIASFEEVLAIAAGVDDDEEAEDLDDDDQEDEEPVAVPPAAARAVARLKANRAEAARLRAEVGRRDADRLVRDAIVARKVAPSRRAEMAALVTSLGLEGLRATIDAMPAQPRPPMPARRERRHDPEAIEAVVAASLDMTPEQFADRKAKHAEENLG